MHDFNVTTFASPTYCTYCGGFLWGLAKQGVRCSKCRATAHKKCALRAVTACKELASTQSSAQLSNKSSGSLNASASTLHDQDNAEYIRQLDSMFWQQVDEETKINNLVSAQTEQPLSLFQTLPANFMQFTAKLAPLSLVHRGATDILMWKRPKHSVAAMCVYSMYCLRPNLLLATPLSLMIAYIVFNYYNSGYAYIEYEDSSIEEGEADSNISYYSGLSRYYQTSPRFFNIVPLASSPSPIPSTRSGAFADSRKSPNGSSMASIASGWQQRSSGNNGYGRQLRERKRSQTTSNPYPSISPDRDPSRMISVSTTGSVHSKANDGLNSAPTSPKGRVLVRNRSSSTGAATLPSPAIDLSAILGVASFGSAKYTDNVHTTQTLTGTYVKVYDWTAAHNYLVDWSQPYHARRILQACVLAQMAVLISVYYIPWYLLFLVGGNCGLLVMSPHVRAFFKVFGVEFLLFLHEHIELRLIRARRWLRRSRLFGKRRLPGPIPRAFSSPILLAHSDGGDDTDDEEKVDDSGYRTPPLLSLSQTPSSSTSTLVRIPHTVSVFENQRWWLGFGWIPRLGSSERAKWSDESGRKRYASLSNFLPEDGFVWADGSSGGGWEVDRLWALPVATDEDGWVYTDNFWKKPASAASAVSSYTRRRKWVRRVRPANSRLDVTRSPLQSGTAATAAAAAAASQS
ncbi:hypothetical protein GGI15_001511 [Coemansia interrupta]|uniref:Phorbol-ester/DAG-type domain-containing protein n=1 Tax=Coemansia interrupta TaxID=1126814 RepID=A0A9W8HP54_9FUNG|nr:hypothetical protein GGI15_001511 [Coemansia interrupta]